MFCVHLTVHGIKRDPEHGMKQLLDAAQPQHEPRYSWIKGVSGHKWMNEGNASSLKQFENV